MRTCSWPQVIRVAVAWTAVAVTTAFGLAQSGDAVTFRIEILRVDLVVGEDGKPTERFVEVTEAVPGEVVEYRIAVRNEGDVIFRPGTVVITLPFGDGVSYQAETATTVPGQIFVEFSADGGDTYAEPPVLVGPDGDRTVADPGDYDHVRWTFLEPFAPDEVRALVYRVVVR